MTALRVQIEGEDADLARLGEALQGAAVTLTLDGETWVIHSPDIDHAPTPSEAYKTARALIPWLVAMSRVMIGRTVPVAIGDVLEGDRRHKFVVAETATIRLPAPRVSGIGTADNPASVAPSTPPESLASVAYRLRGDPRIARVITLLGEPPGWSSLYKVLDVITEDVGSERALKDTGWVGSRKLDRFTNNANAIENATTGGRHARSGYRLGTPMSLDDASALIESLVIHWIRWKG